MTIKNVSPEREHWNIFLPDFISDPGILSVFVLAISFIVIFPPGRRVFSALLRALTQADQCDPGCVPQSWFARWLDRLIVGLAALAAALFAIHRPWLIAL